MIRSVCDDPQPNTPAPCEGGRGPGGQETGGAGGRVGGDGESNEDDEGLGAAAEVGESPAEKARRRRQAGMLTTVRRRSRKGTGKRAGPRANRRNSEEREKGKVRGQDLLSAIIFVNEASVSALVLSNLRLLHQYELTAVVLY